MMRKKSEKHEFALYWPTLSENHSTSSRIINIDDSDLYHRITRILRLKKDDQLILFDTKNHSNLLILDISKQNCLKLQILAYELNTILAPTITFLLPLLKRDAFEQAIYSLVELGANEIQLIITQKTQRKWGGQKEMERLQKIMIAAAEQSKNFTIPIVHEPVLFEQIVKNLDQQATKIFFDAQGDEAFKIIQKIRQAMPQHIVLLVGPEGDLAESEKQLIEKNFIFSTLTPTILRAQQAVAISLGLIRSLL